VNGRGTECPVDAEWENTGKQKGEKLLPSCGLYELVLLHSVKQSGNKYAAGDLRGDKLLRLVSIGECNKINFKLCKTENKTELA
jgi:hypothetical protein